MALDIIKRSQSLHEFFNRKHIQKSEYMAHAYKQFVKRRSMLHLLGIFCYYYFLAFAEAGF